MALGFCLCPNEPKASLSTELAINASKDFGDVDRLSAVDVRIASNDCVFGSFAVIALFFDRLCLRCTIIILQFKIDHGTAF